MPDLDAVWNPDQYRRFADERAQPFWDLLSLVDASGVDRAVDLGCGPGELTAAAAERLDVRSMVGIDSSAAMIARAAEHASATVAFVDGDIARWPSESGLRSGQVSGDAVVADSGRGQGRVDLVLANASLQWVGDHRRTLRRWASSLTADGQLAVQVPANADHASHVIAAAVAASDRFRDAFGPDGPPIDPVAANVLEPEAYSQILFELGFREQHVRLQVYPHVLAHSADVVEWVRGTTLTRFQRRLPPAVFEEFLAAYRRELLAVIGEHEHWLYPFRRILLWARGPGSIPT